MIKYDDKVHVGPMRVNGKDGVEIQLEPDDPGFGTDDYCGDAIEFESHELALSWAEHLVAALEQM